MISLRGLLGQFSEGMFVYHGSPIQINIEYLRALYTKNVIIKKFKDTCLWKLIVKKLDNFEITYTRNNNRIEIKT